MCISTPFGRRMPAGAAVPQAKPVAVQPNMLMNLESYMSTAPPQKPRQAHIVVQHNYHDHSTDNCESSTDHPARGGVTMQFPLKLHEMLDHSEKDGFSHIVSWQPHGRCFVVHRPKEFVELLPRFFKLSKIASFQRQLNLYGFQRLTRGRDKGGYYHELFLRGKPFLSHKIQRKKVKGTGVRARSNPDAEPDFWSMTWITGTGEEAPAGTVATAPSAVASAGSVQETVEQPPPSAPVSAPVVSRPMVAHTMGSHPDDVVLTFGGKSFHFLDPQPKKAKSEDRSSRWTVSNTGTVLDESEMDNFLSDLDLPKEFAALEDDDIFVDMLERIIE